ncbi:MAG TPA: hypothetical protein VHH35_08290 [Pyrinomonadaceae bacterium]|nr:hypothetical protein [Pyrinomonadaceae bacterium]
MNSNSLDLQDYLDATSDASKRTRTFVIVLVVASVLAFVGFLNSFKYSWMLSRIKSLAAHDSQYVQDKLGFVPPNATDERYLQFYTAVVRSYVENAFTIKVPFFGFSFDVNDLGLLGGIGFIVILILLRFSLRSEIVSLRLAFKAVRHEAKENPKLLATFYDLLAMRQVFTLPHLEDEEKQWKVRKLWLLELLAKSSCFLPVIVYSFVAIHDFMTIESIGAILDERRTQVLVAYTITFWVAITGLAIWSFVKWRELDKRWGEFWDDVENKSSNKGEHAKDVEMLADSELAAR